MKVVWQIRCLIAHTQDGDANVSESREVRHAMADSGSPHCVVIAVNWGTWTNVMYCHDQLGCLGWINDHAIAGSMITQPANANVRR